MIHNEASLGELDLEQPSLFEVRLPNHERIWSQELLELNCIGLFLLRNTTVLLITLRKVPSG